MRFNEHQLKKLMKNMGMEQEILERKRVIIEQEGRKIILENPQVVKVSVQGMVTYQIMGEERVEEDINEEDVSILCKEAGLSREEAISLLKKHNNDLASALDEALN